MAEKNSLWKNIRANRGSGKEPTDEMLEQEKKIKSKYPDGGTYANKQGVIMGPVENPDGSYTLPVSTEGLPQVNLPEFEVALESNPYGPVTGDEYLESNFNPINWVLPSVEPEQAKFRPDGTLIPASGRADIDNTLPLAFMGAKPNYANFEKGVNKVGNVLKPSSSNIAPQQMGFINTKGALQKYPKGKLTEEEIDAFKNSDFYKQTTKEHLKLKNKYGDSWTLSNYAEDALVEAIATGNRSRINPILYGGRNWGANDYTIAGLAGIAYPGYAGIMGLVFSPPVVRDKILNAAGITSKPGVLSSKDTTINITNSPMDFAKVNETADGQVILGGEFIEGANNTVRKAKDWLTATDTYSDKEYPSKDIQSFYGVENGKFKVGKASDFKPNTEIVPRRFGATNISQAILNEGAMRLLDNQGNPIYQNTPNTGKFILYSPSTKETEFNYINTGKSGVDKVNKFLKKNKDAQYIHLDNGRYEFYGLNPEGLSDQDFRDYYQQDLEREGNPGYNMILKAQGGYINPYNQYAQGGSIYNNGGFIGEDGDGKRKPTYLSPAELGGRQIMEPSTTRVAPVAPKLQASQYYAQADKDVKNPKITDDDFRDKYGTNKHTWKMKTDPQYKAEVEAKSVVSNKMNGTLDFPSSDMRSKSYQGNPNLNFMVPAGLKGEARAAYEQSQMDVVGAALPIPGLQQMGKIPSVLDAGKNTFIAAGKTLDKFGNIITTQTPVKNAYKLNPNLENPLGYRNLGDNPHWWKGFNKEVTPETIDLENGFKEYKRLFKANEIKLQKLLDKNKIDWGDYYTLSTNYESDLISKSPFGRKLGMGSYGSVYEFKNYPEKAIKFGSPYGNKWTPELIKEVQSMNTGNIAIPNRYQTFEVANHWKNTKPSTYEVSIMDNLNKTNFEKLDLSARDRYALFLKQARKLRDKGIGLDMDNTVGNIKFNPNKGVYDIYDVNPKGFSYNPEHYMHWVNANAKRVYNKGDLTRVKAPRKYTPEELKIMDTKTPREYSQGGFLQYDGDKNKIQKAVASTTAVNTRALPEGLFESIKANPPARQPQIVNIVDKRKQNPITKGPINPNKDLVGGQFEDTIPIEIIKSSYKHGVDPGTALSVGLLESRMGTTDPNVGHIMVDPYSDYMPSAEDMVLMIKQKQEYAKKLGYTDPLLQLQAYNGLGVLSNKKGEIGKYAYGIPIPKEGIDLRQNPLYGKKAKNVRDSVIMQSPDLIRLMDYYKPKMNGGPINPNMYYSGGPIEYGRGGNFLKHLGAGAYALGEGLLDTVTGGATDQLTDRGFEWFTKIANKNMDLSNPRTAKFYKTQQQIKGYTNTAAAVGAGIVTGNVQGAVQQGTKGLNTAFQASDWASDDFKKWSGISSQAIGIGAGLAGGSLNTEGASKGASEAAAKVGEIGGKVSPFVNQAVGMFGNNQQPMWQQAQAQQDRLNSPEYAAQQSLNNQQYVNQGLSFASQGGHINNEKYLVNLQNSSMRNRYNNYKNKYANGGTFNQHGINFIPESAGLHHQSAYGGVPIGPDALAEGGEAKVQMADGGQYIVSGEVDGANTQSINGETMTERLKRNLRPFMRGSLASNPNNREDLKRPFDSYSEESIAQRKEEAIQETEAIKMQRNGAVQYAANGGKLTRDIEKIVMEEYSAAYGGKLPNKFKGKVNMPNSYDKGGRVREFAKKILASKGGYVYNAMEQPMLAQGGPLVSNVQQPFNGPAAQNRGGMMMANGGMMQQQQMQQQGGQDQLMQLVQAYAQATGVSPEELIQQLQQMEPQAQQQAIQQMAQELQGGQQQGMQRQQMPPQQGMMSRGGRMRYDGGGPYDLPGMVDMSQSEYDFINNLSIPNVVDNQGNTSSILSRSRRDNTRKPVQPIQSMQSKYTAYPTNIPTQELITNNPESSYRPTLLTPEEESMLNRMSNTAGFIPSDVMANRMGTSIAPSTDEVGPININNTMAREARPSIQEMQSIPLQNMDLSNGKLAPGILSGGVNEKPELAPFSPGTYRNYNPNTPSQPNEGLTGLDYVSALSQAGAGIYQLATGLQGADPVNYERVRAEKIDPTVSIILAAEESRRAQDTAGYNLRQNAPTSGSYMSNMRGLGLQAGKQRGAQAAGLRQAADVENARTQTGVNAQNAQISMQEQIDRLQEKDAARTNITEGISTIGSSTANMIRDYRINEVNTMIAKNIGTNDWKFDPVNETITFRNKDGNVVTVPAQTVIPSNVAANVGTGKIQNPGTSQFQTNIDEGLNKGFRNRFRGPNSGK
jgi:hypothetical protein